MKPKWLLDRVQKTEQLPEKFQAIAIQTAERLQSRKIEKGLAEQLAVHIVIDLMAEFGGQEIYFNKCMESFRHERDAEIRDRFRRAKATAIADGVAFKPYLERLCREFNLTERQVREIAQDHEGQGELF